MAAPSLPTHLPMVNDARTRPAVSHISSRAMRRPGLRAFDISNSTGLDARLGAFTRFCAHIRMLLLDRERSGPICHP